MPLPERPGMAIAVADVQGPGRVDALGGQVDWLPGELELLGVAGQEGLVDLQDRRARSGQLARLDIEQPSERADQLRLVDAGSCADAAGQRERAREGELDQTVGVGTG